MINLEVLILLMLFSISTVQDSQVLLSQIITPPFSILDRIRQEKFPTLLIEISISIQILLIETSSTCLNLLNFKEIITIFRLSITHLICSRKWKRKKIYQSQFSNSKIRRNNPLIVLLIYVVFSKESLCMESEIPLKKYSEILNISTYIILIRFLVKIEFYMQKTKMIFPTMMNFTNIQSRNMGKKYLKKYSSTSIIEMLQEKIFPTN